MKTWFLGSMFLDKYFIVNQNHYASNAPGMEPIYPVIGIYDKQKKEEKEKKGVEENEELVGGFTTSIGHCGTDDLK